MGRMISACVFDMDGVLIDTEPVWRETEHDVFARVGGAETNVSVTSCLVVNSHNVLIDNIWLWRADHGSGVGWTTNTSVPRTFSSICR